MGAGDWIMATSQVRALNEKTGRRVVVCDMRGRARWIDGIFDNNPRISPVRARDTATLVNSGGARPYIEAKSGVRWTWKRWDIAPGELFFDAKEMRTINALRVRDAIGDAVLIEPHTKDPASNKAWIWDRWQAVALSGVAKFVQAGPAGTRILKGVTFIETPTFRVALLVLKASRGYVGTEGGLHHAAAAIGIPAVVLWSHFIAPEFTGYATHTNIRHAVGWCGLRVPCPECRASMERIHANEVVGQIARMGDKR